MGQRKKNQRALAKEKRGEKDKEGKEDRGLATRVIAGNILKKYRCIREMGRSTGLDRRNLAKSKGKLIYPARKRQARKQEQLTKAVIEFLERDDNSQMMPGKGDFKSCDGVKIQKWFLNDYMHNLHSRWKR